MRKRCKTHGWFNSLISSDSEMYLNSLKYNKPGTMPLGFSTEVVDGCPKDCGLCPEHLSESIPVDRSANRCAQYRKHRRVRRGRSSWLVVPGCGHVVARLSRRYRIRHRTPRSSDIRYMGGGRSGYRGTRIDVLRQSEYVRNLEDCQRGERVGLRVDIWGLDGTTPVAEA